MKNLEALKIESIELRNKVTPLVVLKNELFSNMDIETPMCSKEEELTKEIASVYSRLNQIVSERRKLIKNN